MKIGIVSECVVKTPMKLKCDKCGKEYEVSIDKDFYINLQSNSVRHRCPHCNAEYDTSFSFSLVKDKKDENS